MSRSILAPAIAQLPAPTIHPLFSPSPPRDEPPSSIDASSDRSRTTLPAVVRITAIAPSSFAQIDLQNAIVVSRDAAADPVLAASASRADQGQLKRSLRQLVKLRQSRRRRRQHPRDRRTPPPPELPAGRSFALSALGQSPSAPSPRRYRPELCSRGEIRTGGASSNASLRTQLGAALSACRRSSTDATGIERKRASPQPMGLPDHSPLLQTTEQCPQVGRPVAPPARRSLIPVTAATRDGIAAVPRRATPPLATAVCRSDKLGTKPITSAAATLAAHSARSFVGYRQRSTNSRSATQCAGVRCSPARSTEWSWLFHAPPERVRQEPLQVVDQRCF